MGPKGRRSKPQESQSGRTKGTTFPRREPAHSADRPQDRCFALASQGPTASNAGNDSRANEGLHESGIILSVRSDESLPSNEARLSPSSLRVLDVVSGAVLCVRGSGPEPSFQAYVEVFLCASCASQSIVLATEVAASFDEKHVSVSAVKSSSPLTPFDLVVLEVTKNTQGCGGRSVSTEVTDATCLQVCAAFRRQYHGRLVFRGMRSTAYVKTAVFYVEVVQCTAPCSGDVISGCEQEGKAAEYGIMLNGTVIRHIANGSGYGGNVLSAVSAAVSGGAVPSHLLVVGDPGSGKSHFLCRERLEAIKQRSYHVEVISVEQLACGNLCDISSSAALLEIFARAKIAAPSVVFIDDLHLACGSGSDEGGIAGSAWAKGLLAATLADELDDIWHRRLSVRVVASASSAEILPRSLSTYGRLDKQVKLLPPATAEERQGFLRGLIHELHKNSVISETVLLQVGESTAGFTQRDLSRLLQVAAVESFKKTGRTCLSDSSLLEAVKIVPPSALKQFNVSIPDISWDDIGGSEEAKKTLKDCVSWCLGKQQWVFQKFNLTPPKGVLLYGPPGCSKTMLAKALANETKMNFVSVKGPEVFSKWVGDSEKAVREIFARARAAAPCVVFIDELDGMCGHRGRGGVSDRVISQFLTELDGLPAALTEGADALVFVAATNRPDNIDPAVLRPGRIDRKVYVGLPDHCERRMIVDIQFRNIPIAPDLDAHYVASRTEGYSGAEVVAVVKEAAFLCITADAKAKYISRENVETALQIVKPRINPRDVEWYKQWSTGDSVMAN